MQVAVRVIKLSTLQVVDFVIARSNESAKQATESFRETFDMTIYRIEICMTGGDICEEYDAFELTMLDPIAYC